MTTTLAQWLAAPPMHALGWALLHFLWQASLVALLLRCLLSITPSRYATVRHAAACLAMLALVLLPILTFAKLLSQQAGGRHFSSDFTASEALAPVLTSNANPLTAGWLEQSVAVLNHALPAIICLWLTGVLLLLTRMNIGLLAARKLKRETLPIPSEEIATTFHNLMRRLKITQAVTLAQSAWVEVPSVIGWLRPAILLPIGCLAGLGPAQLEALLAHELAHIRRGDYLISVLQAVVESLLFYHPAVWWISRQIRMEREHCCDDIAVQACGNRLVYAQTLSQLEARRNATTAMALGAHGGSLTRRIKRLLDTHPQPAPTQARGITMATTILIAAALLLTAHAESRKEIPTTNTQAATIASPQVQQSGTTGTIAQGLGTPSLPATQVALLEPHQPSQPSQEPGSESEPLHSDPYQAWINQDVRWIIAPEERAAFLGLQTKEERDQFIVQFWERHNPTPGSPENAFRSEHYRRIAYANEHFGGSIPGWATDRGRIFIQHGRPDSIDAHPAGSADRSEPFELWHYNTAQLSQLPLTQIIVEKPNGTIPQQILIPGDQPGQIAPEQLQIVPRKPVTLFVHSDPLKPVEFKPVTNVDFNFVDICNCGNYRLEP